MKKQLLLGLLVVKMVGSVNAASIEDITLADEVLKSAFYRVKAKTPAQKKAILGFLLHEKSNTPMSRKLMKEAKWISDAMEKEKISKLAMESVMRGEMEELDGQSEEGQEFAYAEKVLISALNDSGLRNPIEKMAVLYFLIQGEYTPMQIKFMQEAKMTKGQLKKSVNLVERLLTKSKTSKKKIMMAKKYMFNYYEKKHIQQIKAGLFEGGDLKGYDLSGLDLSGAKLKGTNLTGADLNAADLSGADLSGAKLKGANLSGANLSGANLSKANLFLAKLNGAILNKADLTDAFLNGADLELAHLKEVNLEGAHLSQAHLTKALVIDSNLRKVHLDYATFKGAILKNVSLEGAFLFQAKFKGAKVSGIALSNPGKGVYYGGKIYYQDHPMPKDFRDFYFKANPAVLPSGYYFDGIYGGAGSPLLLPDLLKLY